LKIIEDRSPRYDSSPHLSISGIDDVQNGVLLDVTVHKMLSLGHVSFLKVRNCYSLNLAPYS
jgi:hypothetical protein